MWRRPRSRESGQGLTEFLGLVLIMATSLALGASLLPASELPALSRNGFREAVCTTQQVADCEQEDVNATSDDDDGSTDDSDDQGSQPSDDEGDGGDSDDGGGISDFFSGAADVISDGASALWEGAKQVGGFFKGVGEQFWDTVTGLWDTITNPAETWEGIKQIWNDPVGSAKAIWEGITEPIVDDWNNGNYGEAIGRGVFSIAEVIFGGKGLTKLGKVGKVKPHKPKTDKPKTDKDKDKDGDDDTSGKDKDDDEQSACPRSWRGTAGGAVIDLYEDNDKCKPQGTDSLSDEAKDTLKYIDEHNGQPPKGYKKHGYENDPDKYHKDGKPDAQKLPDTTEDGTPITYTTYYTNKKVPGQKTNGERLVYGSDGSVWYTTDHYVTMTRVR